MRVTIDAAIPDIAFQTDEMPVMIETGLFAFDDIRHVCRIINIMTMAAFKDFLARHHGSVFYRWFRQRIARPADWFQQQDGIGFGLWFLNIG